MWENERFVDSRVVIFLLSKWLILLLNFAIRKLSVGWNAVRNLTHTIAVTILTY